MILSVDSVSKRFGEFTALDRVTIGVPEQSIFGLLGPNGAGKTTLIRIINQITGPDEGEVHFGGERLGTAHIHQIGYLPEERGLYKKMKVGEQALYLAQLKGLSNHEAKKRLKQWFEKMEIQSWWDRKVEELSKGMQQKVQFIITVVHEPKLLIFDEPFSGFDPINVNLLRDEILELRDKGATIIFSTHNMASVEELCDNIALINKSKLILNGPMNEIRRQYALNAFNVKYRSTGSQPFDPGTIGFEIIDHTLDDTVHSATYRLPAGKSPNLLLSALMPHAEILGYSEVIPSMNDIFISTVNAENNNPNAANSL